MLLSTIKSNTCKLRQNYEFEASFVYIVPIKKVEGIQIDLGLRW